MFKTAGTWDECMNFVKPEFQLKSLKFRNEIAVQDILRLTSRECIIPDSHPWFKDNLSQINSGAMRKWCRAVKTWFIHFPAAQYVV